MKDLFFAIKSFRFFLALGVSLVAWIILNIILATFIENDYVILAFSTTVIGVMLYSYIKELIQERIA